MYLIAILVIIIGIIYMLYAYNKQPACMQIKSYSVSKFIVEDDLSEIELVNEHIIKPINLPTDMKL